MAEHRITRDEVIWSFDAAREPMVLVDPGTVIEIETWDCFTGQVQSEEDTLEGLDLSRVNSATGPIGVRGAEPGDTLSVTLLDIRPNEQGAAMCIPEWGQLIDTVHSPTTRIFRVANGTVTMNEHVSFPARPMFGVIGVSPASGDVSTFYADRHGGNMDDHVNGIGATIHLPVFQSGAQLAIGDMHASMGDGEISGTGVEISGEVTIRVGLLKGKQGTWPVTELADRWVVHGTAGPDFMDALDRAAEEGARFLVEQWGFTIEEAFVFLSVACDANICQACRPQPFSTIARIAIPKIAAAPKPFS